MIEKKRKEVRKVKFITTCNPALHSIEGLIRIHIHYLHSDEVFKKAFTNSQVSVIYNCNKKPKGNGSTFFIPQNLALKVIVLLLAVTNVTFARTF